MKINFYLKIQNIQYRYNIHNIIMIYDALMILFHSSVFNNNEDGIK